MIKSEIKRKERKKEKSNGAKQGQTGPNRAKRGRWGQTGPNRTKKDQTGPNGAEHVPRVTISSRLKALHGSEE